MLYTTEMVFRGHPDKVCDQISDAVLDECIKKDPNARVACEVIGGKNNIFITGEISVEVDYESIVKRVLSDIGYGADYEVIVDVSKQSPDINLGTNDLVKGASDQGMMFGYACDETDEYMPLGYMLAKKMATLYDEHRKINSFLKPDGKCQVTMEYKDDKPFRIHTIVFSHQHEDIEYDNTYVLDNIIKKVCGDYIDRSTIILINPTSRFVLGGFKADSGLTGRKIIVDTYGSYAKHGGGAFSGKDSTKVDRTGAYILRKIAKNIVAKKMVSKIEIQISYCIGKQDPISINFDTFNTNKVDLDVIRKYINTFDLRPHSIIEHLDLLKPIYEESAQFGHFGNDTFPWEKID